MYKTIKNYVTKVSYENKRHLHKALESIELDTKVSYKHKNTTVQNYDR